MYEYQDVANCPGHLFFPAKEYCPLTQKMLSLWATRYFYTAVTGPATGPSSEPEKANSHIHTNWNDTCLCLWLSIWLPFLQGFQLKIYVHFLLQFLLCALPNVFSFMFILIKLVSSLSKEASHFAVFCIFISLLFPRLQHYTHFDLWNKFGGLENRFYQILEPANLNVWRMLLEYW
jgi:hypothetical protein